MDFEKRRSVWRPKMPHLWVPAERELRRMMGRRAMMAAAGGGAYSAQSVLLDGTNDYLSSGAPLTGVSDGKECVGNLWFNVKGGDGTERDFFAQAGNVTELLLKSSNKLQFDMNGASTRIITTPTYLTAGGWNHLLWSLNANAGGSQHFEMWVNDAEVAYDTQAVDDSNKDFTFNWGFGSRAGTGTAKMWADVADVWIMFGLSYDFNTVANRRKFITAGLKPVDLGANGQNPTGGNADIFLHGPVATWHTNDGDGGGFTENGTLTAGTDSPSD